MAGRGVVPEKQEVNPKILVLNQHNKWAIAKDPLHWDKSVAGVGPGLSFAQTILKNLPNDVSIGLVPCACGGSPIEAGKRVILGTNKFISTRRPLFQKASCFLKKAN